MEDYGITAEEIQNYSGKYQNILEELRKEKNDEDEIFLDIEYELEILRTETIDYHYIISLIQKYIPDEDEKIVEKISDEKVDDGIKKLSETNSGLAEIVGKIWENLKKSPENYRELNIANVIDDTINKIIDEKITALANEWCLDKNQIYFCLNNFSDEALGNLNSDFEKFKMTHNISKLHYLKQIKKIVRDLITDLQKLTQI